MTNAHALRFAAGRSRLLAFGFALTFASSIGQTYFIGVFGPAVQQDYGLSHAQWGAIYMAGTLASAALLPWTGAQIDRMPLGRYTALVVAGLVVAAAFMALVPGALFLILAIFLLRQTGQGLASHTGTTAVARHFGAHRGKAIALVSLGFSVGETVLPFLAVIAIAAIGWRATFGGAALILALVLPLVLWLLLRGARRSATASTDRDVEGSPAAQPQDGSWTRGEVLRDPRFYLILPAVMAPSFMVTALFFHHLTLAGIKGWSAAWLTGSYWIYAAGSVIAMLASGPLIDRIRAVRVLPAFLMPLCLGLMVLWAFDDPLWAWPYLFLIGLTSGIAFTAVTALWAEVYGVWHLGAIRSMAVALSVFSSALGPPVMGGLMDIGVSIETICASFAGYCLAASLLLVFGLKGMARRPLPGAT